MVVIIFATMFSWILLEKYKTNNFEKIQWKLIIATMFSWILLEKYKTNNFEQIQWKLLHILK